MRTSRLAALLVLLIAASVQYPAEVSSSVEEIPFRHIVIDRDNPTHPHCKAAGDIDGDGFADVLAASAFGEGLYWYEYPNWSKHRIDTGSFTTDMQVGDVDADGDLDIIIPKNDTGLSWYENPRPSADPTTAAWRLRPIDTEGAHDVETGDVDGDGRLDVVVRDTRGTRVFLQTSPASWKKIAIPTAGRGGTALGDLDGDGDLDIAENGYWLEAPETKTDQTWPRHEMAAGWPDDVGVHIADVNGDGRQDVLLAPAERAGRLSWYEAANPKQGPWTEHVIDSDVTHIHTFKTADVDKDGDLDVVTSEMEQSPLGRVTIYYNQGEGRQWRPQVVGRSGSHNLRLADIGNDGDIDIVGANHGNHGGATPIEMWENLSADAEPSLSLNRWKRHVVDADRPWRSIFIDAADLDGDALKDLVTGGWWYRNPGPGGQGWTRQTIGDPLNNMAVLRDFDGDGHMDILGTQGKASEASARFVWARNDGRGNFTILDNIPQADGDFLQGAAVLRSRLGDPIQVALSWHAADKGVQILVVPENPSEEMWQWRKISDASQDEQLSVADVDRDVRQDLLLGTKWLRNEGSSWQLHTLSDTSGDPDRNRWADMNGDGLLDAVVGFEAINVPGKLAWYEQPPQADGIWTEHVIGMPVGPMSVDVADMDRDGDLDVVVGEHNYRNPATTRLLVFENRDGKGGRWRENVLHAGDEHHDGAVVVDIDNDGDLDIISIGWSHANVLVYENRAIVSPPDSAAINLEVWYGREQRFGHTGNPQKWVNVLGRVTGRHPIVSLRYTLNGATLKPLSMGPNRTRLAQPGDFNIEIAHDKLKDGANTVSIEAVDSEGNRSSQAVNVHYAGTSSAPPPYSIDWSKVSSIQDVAQVVDGLWELTPNGVRVVEPYYDRVIALGDESWTDYEITVPVTFHGFRRPGPQDGGRSVIHAAIAVRWPGHGEDGKQPRVRWYPLGATSEFMLTGYPQDCRWRILGDNRQRVYEDSDRRIEMGKRYMMKKRVQSLHGNRTAYSVKFWPAEEAEPEQWDLRAEEIKDVTSGGALLIAHYSIVTFGNVTITPTQ